MPDLSRRGFLAAAGAAVAARSLPIVGRAAPQGKRVLTLVYDKALGAMRAVDKVVR